MKKFLLLASHFFAFAYMAGAQNPLPDTDIFICDVEFKKGKYSFKNLKNITNREGYDNQPSFIDNNTILYTSIREDKQADIYKYDLQTNTITQISKIHTDEYSPTLTPDKRNISFVRVEQDSTQRLWKFPITNPNHFNLVLPDLKGVGYHCWVNENNLALFVLGEPFTLQLANLPTGESYVLDSFIGRSIQKTSAESFSFVSKRDSIDWKICSWTFDKHKRSPTWNFDTVISLPKNSEDFVYLNGHYWVGNGSVMMKTIIKKRKYVWEEAFDFKGTPAENFYRIAFSPDGKKLALVSYVGKKP